eukprot:CAMPEP_0167750462 /NCGR_PEP_ID=MMETSP0110_2-20121227/6006_1 /TAXON_ID=629695 /ORGANISM="Gymnochlora sp., Strain CCMP2014" /LENGTH=461 /DNA_ID=CAMNT_0007635789 /DNA_START=353 /DNA_END=1738 /DNA_ORIENTATION=+
MVNLNRNLKVFEVDYKLGVSVRVRPGLDAKRTKFEMKSGSVFIGCNVTEVGNSIWVQHSLGWSCSSLKKQSFISEIFYRTSFQVILKQGVAVRDKPLLKLKPKAMLPQMSIIQSREVSAKIDGGKKSVWVRHLSGWSCMMLGELITMAPVGEGAAWWNVIQKGGVSIRTSPGINGHKRKTVAVEGQWIASKSVHFISQEGAFWIKHAQGFSCAMMKSTEYMRPLLGMQLMQITAQHGSYIRAKPGAAKQVLGLLPIGSLFLSKGVISIEGDGKQIPNSLWSRHGLGWTCIQYGQMVLAQKILPVPAQVKAAAAAAVAAQQKQQLLVKTRKRFSQQDLFGKNAPKVVQLHQRNPSNLPPGLISQVTKGDQKDDAPLPKYSEATMMQSEDALGNYFDDATAPPAYNTVTTDGDRSSLVATIPDSYAPVECEVTAAVVEVSQDRSGAVPASAVIVPAEVSIVSK